MFVRIAFNPLALALILLSGCELIPVGEPPSVNVRRPVAAASGSVIRHEYTSRGYVMLMKILAEADSQEAKALRQEIASEAEAASNDHNRLRLALALSRPGNGLGRLREARDLLQDLRAQESKLEPELRDLAAARYVDVKHRLSLLNTIVSLRNQLSEIEDSAADTAQVRRETMARTESSRRALVESNERLRRALAEANEKLEAVRRIESAVERTNSSTQAPTN
ncbi:MAG: hypothetical protein ACR2RL_08015 [Gammaproteobacteria bacterium]